MIEILAGAAAAAAGTYALQANARAYATRAETRWPPIGRFIEADGARLHVAEAGAPDAPAVLLIHGASANLRELWTPIGLPLAETHRVLAFDRPG